MTREIDHGATTVTSVRRDLARVPTLELVATAPDGREAAVPLGMMPPEVGTDADCAIVLPDPAVSRRHARFTLTEKGVLVRDLDSKNGTSIGGTYVREAYMSPSSAVCIGNMRLRVRVAGAPT